MPRGFLVKRSRRLGGSYRGRPPARALPLPAAPELPPPAAPSPPPVPASALPLALAAPASLSAPPAAARRPPQQQEAAGAGPGPVPGQQGLAGSAPAPPEGPAGWGAGGAGPPKRLFFERCLSSPASAESFPAAAAAFPPAEPPLPPPPRTPLPAPAPAPPAALCPALQRPPRAKAPAKKPKAAARRLSFADEVTTSPVLGLRIKEEAAGGAAAAAAGGRAGRTPLGEFICQLCKEHYADPLALAQHRCSRIVRVEYRCPECHKIFSCPANLASHRRWHKPRPGPDARKPPPPPPPPPPPGSEGKENSGLARPDGPAAAQHLGAADSACRRDPPLQPPPAPPPGPSAAVFACPCCHKRFRRQAYLRKHLGTHEAARPGPAGYGPGPGPGGFPCPLCGAPFPSAELRDKHGLWHAVRDELLLPPRGPAEGRAAEAAEQRGFPCKHCPAAFFSAPGLARHVSKCHPPDGRAGPVLLLHVPLRPGC
ncbi:insulinoma-associated protein 2 [Alligator mississippiensis]|uniref:insulinoma-associated protein 2 n=1 Tax=Alligator mississippiensis TaxID=8496 RepID=UPI00287783C5|nr:insulinoma-associated protein 2 [Alligator mississippiensis]